MDLALTYLEWLICQNKPNQNKPNQTKIIYFYANVWLMIFLCLILIIIWFSRKYFYLIIIISLRTVILFQVTNNVIYHDEGRIMGHNTSLLKYSSLKFISRKGRNFCKCERKRQGNGGPGHRLAEDCYIDSFLTTLIPYSGPNLPLLLFLGWHTLKAAPLPVFPKLCV